MLLARLDENNTVVELADLPDDIDPMSAFHPSLKFVQAKDGVKVGAKWDGKTFVGGPEEVKTEGSLPKDVLKDRAAAHRRILLRRMILKVREWQTAVDGDTLAAIAFKIAMIDAGTIQQPVQFKLKNGFASLTRDNLAELQKEIAKRIQTVFAAEAALVDAIEKGRVKTQEEVEAAFPQAGDAVLKEPGLVYGHAS